MGMFFDDTEDEKPVEVSKFKRARELQSYNGDSTEKVYEVDDLVNKDRLHATNVDDYVYRRGKERVASGGQPFTTEEEAKVREKAENAFKETPINWYRSKDNNLGKYNPNDFWVSSQYGRDEKTTNTKADQRDRKILGTEDMVLAPGGIGLNPVIDDRHFVFNEKDTQNMFQAGAGHEMRHALDYKVDDKDTDEARKAYRSKTLEDAYGYLPALERVTTNFDIRDRISVANGGKTGAELDAIIDGMSDEELYKYLKSNIGYSKPEQYRRKKAEPQGPSKPAPPFEQGDMPGHTYDRYVGRWLNKLYWLDRDEEFRDDSKYQKRYVKRAKELFGEDYEKKMSQYRDALREWRKQNGAHQEVLRKYKENPTEIDPEKMSLLRKALKNVAANEENPFGKGYNMFLA